MITARAARPPTKNAARFSDILDAYELVLRRVSAAPLQSPPKKMKTNIHLEELSRDGEKNYVGISQVPLSNSENTAPKAARTA